MNSSTNSRRTSFPYSAPTLIASFCILAIATGTLLSACNLLGGDSGGRPDTLVPLDQGNRWEFRATEEDIEDITLEVVGGETIEVTSEPEVETFRVEEQQSGGIILGEPLPFKGVLLKYPVEEGDSYSTELGGSTVTVDVAEQSVTVPAGEYECLLYTIRGGGESTTSRIWVKPGVGPVKLSDGDEVEELVSTNVSS